MGTSASALRGRRAPPSTSSRRPVTGSMRMHPTRCAIWCSGISTAEGLRYARAPMSAFEYQDLLPIGADQTTYRLVTSDHVSTAEAFGKTFLKVEAQALTTLTREAMRDIAHLLRPGHLAQLR